MLLNCISSITGDDAEDLPVDIAFVHWLSSSTIVEIEDYMTMELGLNDNLTIEWLSIEEAAKEYHSMLD